MKDYGSRENRGRTSPSTALSREAPRGADPSEGRATAVTVIRRVGHIGVVAAQQLERMATREGDQQLARAVVREVLPLFERLVAFSFEFTEVPDVSTEVR